MKIKETKQAMRKIRTKTVTPNIYAVSLLARGGRYVYMGVHHSLDEACEAGMVDIDEKLGGVETPSKKPSIDVWASYSGKRALEELSEYVRDIPTSIPPTILHNEAECEKVIKEARNALMKFLIEKNDEKALVKYKPLLSPSTYRYVHDHICSASV